MRRTTTVWSGWLAQLVPLLGLLLATFPGPALAATSMSHPEAGLPFMQYYSATDYQGGGQNWAVTQDDRGVIYVGNVEDAVLEFDGVRWRSIRTTSVVRSLGVGRDGRVYVGLVGDFGYLAPDEAGQMRYVSLRDLIPEQEREFTDVWKTIATDDGVLFATYGRLFRVDGDSVESWQASTVFHITLVVGKRVFVRETGRGLLELVDGELRLLPDGERFAEDRVYAVLPAGDDPSDTRQLLIATRESGWFKFDGSQFRPWRTEVDEWLRENLLYGGVRLKNGLLAVATLQGGIAFLDRNGTLLARISKAEGLPDNTVFALAEDRQGGLWLAFDDGIARLDTVAALTRFDETSGLEGTVLALQRYAGRLYVGTIHGLYGMSFDSAATAKFERAEGIKGLTWDFLDTGEELLIANLQGVYALRAGKAQLIRPSAQATAALLRSRREPRRVYVGLQNGLASIRREAAGWEDEGQVPGIENEVRSMHEAGDGRLWLGTMYGGALRLRWPDDHGQPIIERYRAEHGLPSQGLVRVYPVRDQLRFATTRGLYRFNEEERRFYPDPEFSELFQHNERDIVSIREDAAGRVWIHAVDADRNIRETGFAFRGDDGKYHWDARALSPINGEAVSAILATDDSARWFGGRSVVYRLDLGVEIPLPRDNRALLRGVFSHRGKRVLHSGGADAIRLPYAENALRFEYALPDYGLPAANRYQVMLEGVDDGWSQWNSEAYRDYTSIPPGNYRFRVRARNVYGVVSDEATFSFLILPPWYLAWWAYLLYLLTLVGVVVGAVRWRSRSLRRYNRELAGMVAERTRELAVANATLEMQSVTDPLTGLKNRRFLLEHMQTDIATIDRHYRTLQMGREPETPEDHDVLFVMVDIDHFKRINDTHGHFAGDRVLQQMGEILSSAIRETDTAVRWGGEEFLVVARFSSPDSGPVLAERIRAMVEEREFDLGDGNSIRLTVSIGFASYPIIVDTPCRGRWENVALIADKCCYVAKHNGRNAWVGVQGKASSASMTSGMSMHDDLRAWLEAGELRLLTSLREHPTQW